MAAIRLFPKAAQDMMRAAEVYGEKNNINGLEMGLALATAGFALLSVKMNNVQLDETYLQLKELSATLRKPNAS